MRLPLTTAAILGCLGLIFLWLGMWWYWVRLDDSGRWSKRFWFIVLLAGFGTAASLISSLSICPQPFEKRGCKSNADVGTSHSRLLVFDSSWPFRESSLS